ncbi:four helix bundle protein [Candidatus Roizmanbacteria bacterium CG02_land_8_20_14_3_00_36_15]|uniref:Four helix bundle protein n=1 Tax=Candidatus Roizmanbacteria bacterium CG10_big_fil_rev_8_21_14_0_10_36_26 TaxID=1974851 RepID=A0A2M8KKI3_9BACT|nr:MAG: four helix bundle protein [Candidatus Roizmanbacteria bacterium CG03_land_8_20_14_0_80_36_21]PIV37528.1 MAG: four helix bundle protein [Candidatus Roizmanbacteria bacterium CG02_land_8_20_14_3_00_36_15]PJA53837.1 MAG: four helix bundle protein [Candidatus Roizmanbacteria bacterium CG_4_9_14_3_um_filter_36_11]PJE60437.1 MAG: four helix bundle protein [Candidatus Roizmanbacteria bacterium CG10_big_fil_rev_8_21_14_0_10_36_26]
MKKFDLEDRTAKLGENIIIFCQLLRITIFNEPLIKQLIRSSTSVGANYMEANGGNSKKDFKNKISICKKEAKETLHWLRMLAVTNKDQQERLRKLWQETHEIVLIFAKILSSSK